MKLNFMRINSGFKEINLVINVSRVFPFASFRNYNFLKPLFSFVFLNKPTIVQSTNFLLHCATLNSVRQPHSKWSIVTAMNAFLAGSLAISLALTNSAVRHPTRLRLHVRAHVGLDFFLVKCHFFMQAVGALLLVVYR